MFGASFYNQTTRRYVAVFGTLFNDIVITRKNNAGAEQQRMMVPINYGPMQKFLARTQQDPDLTAPAITLPRMSFEITDMSYDGDRKLTNMTRIVFPGSSANSVNTVFAPAPYDITFQLNIMTKYFEDGSKIIEQILPYFKPEFTVSAQLIDGIDSTYDIPIILNSISSEDTYEGSFEERRALIWTLNFTMKAYYFGPTTSKKVIKFIEVNTYNGMNANSVYETVTIQPGLTANGLPTTDINQTIPYADIAIDDDWATIVRIVEA